MTGAVKRGALIVFEGCDRSGKTTQVQQDKFYPHTQFYLDLAYEDNHLYFACEAERLSKL